MLLSILRKKCIKFYGGEIMKKTILQNLVKIINYSLKVDANSTSTAVAFQSSVPKNLNKFKKHDR